jgi:ABC-2 type transport system ATP-binding protein
MPAIDVRQIVKKFGDFTAVNGVSFSVEEGEIFGLLVRTAPENRR